jgi:hypothetical protein
MGNAQFESCAGCWLAWDAGYPGMLVTLIQILRGFSLGSAECWVLGAGIVRTLGHDKFVSSYRSTPCTPYSLDADRVVK